MKRVLLFGADGPYAAAFSRVLAPHVDIVGCLVRRPIAGLIGHWLRHRTARYEALGFACPVFTVAAYGEEKTYALLRARFAPDLVVSVGFPRKLPAHAMGVLSPHGAINVHPALLPRDRGPCPPFWTLQRGDAETGVTVHVLSDVVDAGDMLFSARMAVPFGCTGAELFAQLGTLGGKLVVDNLATLFSSSWHLHPQIGDPGPWARKPTRDDLQIDPLAFGARHLFAFIRGARTFGVPWARLADDVYHFADALAFEPGRRIPGEFVVLGDQLTVAVKDGTVTLLLA